MKKIYAVKCVNMWHVMNASNFRNWAAYARIIPHVCALHHDDSTNRLTFDEFISMESY